MSRYEMSPEAQMILDFLSKKPKHFTYDEVRHLTGINDLSRLRGYLMTAIRRLRKQGTWYESERGVGYRLLDDDAKNPVQSAKLDRIKRHVGRIDKDQDAIHFEGLSRDGKLAFTFTAARIGRLKEAASLKTTRKLRSEIGNGDIPIIKKK